MVTFHPDLQFSLATAADVSRGFVYVRPAVLDLAVLVARSSFL